MKKNLIVAVLCCFTSVAFAGELENIAGNNSALLPINTLEVANQARANFPDLAPSNSSVEFCHFTEFKRQMCYFKCASGAVIMEPASSPHFISPDLPGGTCPPYATRPITPRASEKSAKDAWHHINLRAADGTRITIDYNRMDLGATIMAEPVWIKVTNPAISADGTVKVKIVTFHEATSYSPESIKDTAEVDLQFDGRIFQRKGPSMLIREAQHSWTYKYRQEISVKVGGKWLIDPVNGTNKFRFKMAE